MALNNLGLGFIFTASDRATGTIRRVGTQFDRTGDQVRRSSNLMQTAMLGIGVGIATMAAGLGTLAGAFRLAEAAGQFGQTMARVGALTRATAEEMDNLRGAAIRAGIATQFDPREAAEGLAELGVRGLQASESITALSSVLDLAAGGNISVAQSASTVAASLRVFGLEASGAALATDQLLRISNVTALQAGDLEIALGNVSRGAGLARQSMEELLPAIGLVRNTGVAASVASNAVSSALIFMARNATKFREVGVEVTDAAGEFRPFLDIIRETNEELIERFPNSADRAARAIELFGRFGVTAFVGINEQIRSGIRDNKGNLLFGAEAIDFLRQTMEEAGGAAAEFRDRMLDTFEGQKTLLAGTIATLETVTGESFGRVFRPFVTAITDVLNIFIQAWTAIPAPLQTTIAAIVVGLGSLLTVFGGAVAIGFGIALILPFLKAMAIAVLVIGVALAPVIVGVAAAGAVIAAFGAAVKFNIGGIGDFFQRSFEQVRLVFRGLTQAFSEGAFSGEVMEEMNRAENLGIKQFVVNLFAIGFRIKKAFEGFVAGLKEALTAGQPAIDRFMEAMTELGNAFGFVGDAANDIAGTDSDKFFRKGAEAGAKLGEVLVFIIDVVRQGVQFTTGFVTQFRKGFPDLLPIVNELGRAFTRVAEAMGIAAGEQDKGKAAAVGAGETFANVLIPAIGSTVGAIVFLLDVTVLIIRAWNFVTGVIGQAIGAIVRYQAAWQNLGDNITIIVNNILTDVLSLVRRIPESIRARIGLGGIEATETRLLTETRIAEERTRIRDARADIVSAEALPATEETRAAGDAARSEFRQAFAGLSRELGRPVNLSTVLQVDSEVLARAVSKGTRTDEAAGFRAAIAGFGAED